MQVCCPQCQSQIDCETLQISGTDFTCPKCATVFDLQEMVAGVSQFSRGFGDDRTRTIELETGELREGDFVGKFQILEVIGRGGFGNVYRAYDRQLERVVALKIPRPDMRSQIDATSFLREAQMAASVRDPNIVGVHEVGQDGSHLYICTDFIKGSTLKHWLKTEQRSQEAVCQMIIRIARSLHKAHQGGLVHRDLKPANILVDEEDTPFVTDFGLARKIVKGSKNASGGQIEIVGTPAYMSPEQAVGDVDHINAKTDVYSLGVMLYEMVSGRRPFKGEVATIIQDILYHEPDPPSLNQPGIPRELDAIIMKAMAKKQGERYATAEDLADDVQRFLDREPTKALPLKGSQHLLYRLRKHRVAILILVFLLGSIGATYGFARFYYDKDPEVVEVEADIPTVAVRISTVPSRASIAVVPIDPESRRPVREKIFQPQGLTPLTLDLPAGDYIVEAYLPGLGVQEVRRNISKQQLEEGGEIEFKPLRILPVSDDLALVEGGKFEVTYDFEGQWIENREISSFYVQTAEVPVGDFRKALDGLPAGFTKLNRVKWNDATPVTRFTVEEAREYAESIGMRLIDYEEFCYVATNKGTTGVPWGEVQQVQELQDFWLLDDVGSYAFDQTLPGTASIPVRGLFTNVPELTGTTVVYEGLTMMGIKGQQDSVAIVGQPISLMGEVQEMPDLPLNARHLGNKAIETVQSLNYPIGFRCARSAQPRFLNLASVEAK